MRIFRIVGLIMMNLIITSHVLLSAKTKTQRNEDIDKIIEMVEQKNFSIEVNRAIPMTGPLINLTTSYSLEIRKDTVVSTLPFYGRASSLPYGGGNGLNFEGVIKDFTYEKNRKGNLTVEFKTQSNDDLFKFRLMLYPNKSALINVQPTHRQSISFQGNLKGMD